VARDVLSHRNHLHQALHRLHRLQDALGQQPQADWSVIRMANLACVSPRHLTRLFLQHAGIAPLQDLRGIRIDVTETALHSGHSVTQAAQIAGFSSHTQLRRSWARRARRVIRI
jgi:transcriptional regulator GlxA family with amidase domain